MIYREVQRFAEKEKLFRPSDGILVALSGGADSVALLRVLLHLGCRCEAAHCNFHLRGEESVRDEEFVRALCVTLGVVLHVRHFDTRAYARQHAVSVEMAARDLRYAWFESLRKERGLDVVAVAHHRDDSVETFLLNLIRGTGINGLLGIRARNGFVVRPLLAVSRSDILRYLDSIGQAYVTDSTNLQDEYMRNKIRLRLLPLMEELNPSVRDAIASAAARLEEVAHIYNKVMQESMSRVKDEKGISIASLLGSPAPRALLHEMLSPLGFTPSQEENVFACLDGQSGKMFYSPGWQLLKDRTHLLLQRREEGGGASAEAECELPGEGSYCYGDGNTIHLSIHAMEQSFNPRQGKDVACLDAGKLAWPLVLRRWRKGDAFVPFGMKGRKLVSDFLTDRKYSLQEKENTYVVCSGNDIVWIVGERPDNRFRIDAHTRRIARMSVQGPAALSAFAGKDD